MKITTTKLKMKTRKIRAKIVLSTAKLITPSIYQQIVENEQFFKSRTPRPFTLRLKQLYKNKPLIGAEIGFGNGLNANSILNILNIKKLYCIDPFKKYLTCLGTYPKYRTTKENLYKKMKKDPRIFFIKQTSDKAFKNLPKNLDFIYIDGLHTQEQCYKDIINSIQHTKIIGGHDYRREYQKTVINAVSKATAKIQIVPTIEFPDYWFDLR